MSFEEFNASLNAAPAPPQGLPCALAALWHEAKGDWQAAHEAVQDDSRPQGCLVHAYLHRKEGDVANAGYWYGRAGRRAPSFSSQEEWAQIVAELLKGT